MRIFITGHTGRIGRRLVQLGCLPLYSNITDYPALNNEICGAHPDVVIHLAGYSNVDWIEKRENQDEVLKVNFDGTNNVALSTFEQKCGMVFLSSDHIFSGKRGPYKENYPYWKPNIVRQYEKPVNYYGLIKMASEVAMGTYENVKIVRTSYLFDQMRIKSDAVYYPNFIYRSFLHFEHFAPMLFEYVNRFSDMPKILHISGSETISWYEFAKQAFPYRKILPRKHDLGKVEGFAPRPYKAGLDVSLSKRLGISQFSYLDGLGTNIDH